MGMPLIVTDDELAALAKKFYPQVETRLVDTLHISEYIVTHFEIIFYSIPRDLFDEVFFMAQKLLQKRIHTIWCPHGNSDKGNNIYFMEALKKEEIALVYGKQMIDFLQRKHVFDQLKAHVIVSNYRYQYYLQNKEFYDGLLAQTLLRRLPPAKRTILYAPTWQDYEKSGTFFAALPHLAEKLPKEHNLIIKLHPNLVEQHDIEVDQLIERYSHIEHLLFVTQFPPVYPLLNACDFYIGDMSSIGYDFLTFNRPMFFLNQNARDANADLGLYLFRCGVQIQKDDFAQIFQRIHHFFQYELRDFSEIRQEVYRYAFGKQKSLEEVRQEIEHTFQMFPDEEIQFF